MVSDISECQSEMTITLFGRKILCPKLIEVNGTVTGMSHNVKDNDKIEVFDYYTLSRVFEFAGIEGEDIVLLNGREAGPNVKVRDGDTIVRKPKPIEVPEDEKVKPEEDFEKQMQEDPLLQPLKPLPDWMEGIPFDTAKLGADGKLIPGVLEQRTHTAAPEPTPAARVSAEPIQVTVNGENVVMPAKEKPIFVDVFDVYPFDLSKAGGTRLITRINGIDKDFTEPLQDGDSIELFWEQ